MSDEVFFVNELFETVQGEGAFTGTPSTFIRLQGCDIGCPWCDTKHTWKREPSSLRPPEEVVSKVESSDTFAAFDSLDLVREVMKRGSRHVVLTGGEPCMYDLRVLSERLMDRGYTVQVETSGTYPVRISGSAWVTVSPKVDMPGGREVLAAAWLRANEVKMPVGKPADVECLLGLIRSFVYQPPQVWLQPLSMSEKATKVCIEQARLHFFKVSVQVHKYLGVR